MHLSEDGLRELGRLVLNAVTELDRRRKELEQSLDIRFTSDPESELP